MTIILLIANGKLSSDLWTILAEEHNSDAIGANRFKMLLTSAVFLFHLLCGLVPCSPRFKPPEILQQPRDPIIIQRNDEISGTLPIVQTPNGALEGYFMRAMNGRLFMAFQGIPYGKAERWKLARPAKPWDGVRQAKKPGHDCLQFNLEKLARVIGNEDCLYINVYTPQLPNSLRRLKRLPVVVFIHGGGFMFGSGAEYGPTYILSEQVILVTINYRLGVLGFLSLGNEEVPGNLGLKDQALALKWVYENIEHFNGDSGSISLWGQSAGASSVQLHLISTKTRKYFSTAFSSSGSAFNHWAVQSKTRMRDLANRLAKRLGCQRRTSKALFRCLQRVDVNFLVVGQTSLYDWFLYPPVLFSPTVEPEHSDAFLTVTPKEAYETGRVARKPYIIGITKDEGKNAMITFLPLMRTFPLRRMWSHIAPVLLQLNGVVQSPAKVMEKVDQFYLKGESVQQVNIDVFGEMISDRYVNFGIVQGVQAHILSGSPTFMYLFSFSEGNHNLANFIGYQSKDWGVGHVEDTTYLFNFTNLVDGQKQTDPDHELSSLMINLLVNFAATGTPTYRTPKGEHLSVWNPTSNPANITVLQLDRDIKMIPFPANVLERLKFWNHLNITF